MNLTTAVTLLHDSGYSMFSFPMYQDYAQEKPFYSDEIYNITFANQEADIHRQIDFIKRNGLTINKNVVEVFGGLAFESSILQRKFPKNKYFSVDNQKYFGWPHKSIRLLSADVFTYEKLPIKLSDVMFVGGTNKSMCCVKTLSDLQMLACFAEKNLKNGGYFLASFFEDGGFGETTDYKVEYQCEKIRDGRYKGLYCHWGMITRRVPQEQKHYYYPVVILSKNKGENLSRKDVVHYFFSEDYESYQSWQYSVVKEVFTNTGFQVVAHDEREYDGSFVAFQKTK